MLKDALSPTSHSLVCLKPLSERQLHELCRFVLNWRPFVIFCICLLFLISLAGIHHQQQQFHLKLFPKLSLVWSKTGKLTVNGSLDYEEKQVYEINVMAADKGAVSLSSNCKVIIRVEDVNDNQPDIDITSLSSHIAEDAPPGTVVALMGVTDRDSVVRIDNKGLSG
ncbi:Protocadherin gamma-C3 [Oryzias melastigma]|uniref:Protocadherin gamma-C3 n=1 Tax=Oryzias melastigma TaxID=30732 RepID=A0A834C6V6_ORYME|nr:Protocadherin gamma-C3 [Oryzias melastigma]